ncbi:MAG TPA: 5-oxoprolinase subunit PxpA [Thermoanaerobaculia bacterium]|nr:5-oxoprolinase subunit PxpA [Thermoanaerobaculia bacterium]
MARTMTKTIDLNFDGGEGCDDAALMPHVTTVNVACGAHAGDAATMRATVRLAAKSGVAVFAHPSYPDREAFGRRRMTLPPAEVERLVREQVSALDAVAREEGVALSGVKPHGGLYHAAASEEATARALVEAARAVDPRLILVTSPGSRLLAAARGLGMRAVAEGFADRGYDAAGSLVPRGTAGALVETPERAAAQALSLARDGFAVSVDGARVPLAVETICLHGDTPGAAANAAAVRRALEEAGIALSALSGARLL